MKRDMSMKKNVKLAALIAAIIMLFSLLAVSAFADGEATEIDTTNATFVVYNADGELVGSGITPKEFAKAVSNAADGDTVKLLKSIDMTSYGAEVAVESGILSPREVSIDLAGNGIYSHIKTVMFRAKSYSTLNIYSSVPGGYVYNNSSSNNDYGHSGANFTTSGVCATINLGRYEAKDGTVYSGYNFSAYSSCIVDLSSSDNNPDRNRANLIEGNYFSVLSDYTGALITRGNYTDIYVKDANVLLDHGSYPINSAVGGDDATITLENCLLIGSADEAKPMFNNLAGLVTFKDVISNYPLTVASTGAEARREGAVLILGDCIFSSRDELLPIIIENNGETEDLTFGRVHSPEYELIGLGGKSIQYYPNIEVNGAKNPMVTVPYNLPGLESAAVITTKDNTTLVRWSENGKNVSIEEYWCSDVKPQPPINVELPESYGDGTWEYGWIKTIDGDGVAFYKVGKCLKLTIYASIESDGDGIIFNVIVPAALIDEGDMLFTDSSINGDVYLKREWEKTTIDGVEYYYTSTPTMYDDEITQTVDIIITSYKEIDGEVEIVSASYEVSLKSYIDYILNAEEGEYDDADRDYATELYDTFLKELSTDDDEPVILPSDDEEEE